VTLSLLIEVSGQGLVRISEVDPCGADLVDLLAVPRNGVGKVDDVEDLGPPEAGDLHSSHEVRLGLSAAYETERPS
jgi:hypothetical protein